MKRSPATAEELYLSLLYLAVLSHHHVAIHAKDQRRADIPRSHTTAIKTMALVRSVRSWLRNAACVARSLSKISSVGCVMSAVVSSAGRNSNAASTLVASHATEQVTAKMLVDSNACSLAASSRRYAVIQTKLHATRHTHAKRRSLARTKSSLHATVKLKSKK